MSRPGKKSRRQFHKTVALLAAAPLAASPAAAPAADPPKTVAQTLAELARVRYGKHLNEEQLAAVRRAIERNQRSAELLARIPLRNSDEPDFVFSPDLP
jgi:hypothetical protein